MWHHPALAADAAPVITRPQISTSAANRAAMSAIASSSVIVPANHALAASPKMVRPTAKPARCATILRDRESLLQRLLRGVEAEQHDAAAERVARLRSPRRWRAQAAAVACGSSFHQSGLRPAS